MRGMALARAFDDWERADAAHRDAGDSIGSVRVARTLAYMYMSVMGDRAVGGGWLARAQSLLMTVADSPEQGWVSLNIEPSPRARCPTARCASVTLPAPVGASKRQPG